MHMHTHTIAVSSSQLLLCCMCHDDFVLSVCAFVFLAAIVQLKNFMETLSGLILLFDALMMQPQQMHQEYNVFNDSNCTGAW